MLTVLRRLLRTHTLVIMVSVVVLGCLGYAVIVGLINRALTAEITSATDRLAGLTRENASLTYEQQTLAEDLTRARSTLTTREDDLEEALAALRISESGRAILERKVRRGLLSVAHSTLTVTVRDTLTLAVDDTGAVPFKDDFIEGVVSQGVLIYEFSADVLYSSVEVRGERGGIERLETARLRSLSTGAERPIQVFSTFTRLDEARARWQVHPAVHGMVTAPDGRVGVGLSLLQRTSRNGVTWRVLWGGVTTGPEFVLIPVSYNIGSRLPFIDHLHVGLGVNPDGWTPRLVVALPF